jgi:uncharacterized LabA/DUF88 family protein
MERVIIFIDNSNIFQGFRKYDIKADYEQLKQIICMNRKLEAIYLYEGVVYPISPQKKKWYEDLKEKSGYIIKASFDKIAKSNAFEKKVDIQIAIDMVSLAYENAYDTGILLTGDGDFIPVVQKIKDLGKRVELWAFRYSLAQALKDEFREKDMYYIDDYLEKIAMDR